MSERINADMKKLRVEIALPQSGTPEYADVIIYEGDVELARHVLTYSGDQSAVREALDLSRAIFSQKFSRADEVLMTG